MMGDLFSQPHRQPKPNDFGTEPRKLVRNPAPTTSVDAACSIDTSKLERMVYETIMGFGEEGCISDQVQAVHPTLAYSSVTARFKALETKELIEYRGDKRPGASGRGQRVMRAK